VLKIFAFLATTLDAVRRLLYSRTTSLAAFRRPFAFMT
jgi:hypothetical protein